MRRFLIATVLIACTAACFAQEDRAADRQAIRKHIESIFQAFIDKDANALRATHAQNWLGYLEGSRTMIRGNSGYMDNVYVDPSSPYGMKSYRMREFDMIFQGDAAFVCFTADVDANTPTGPSHRVLRITDFYTKQNGAWIQTGSNTDLHPESTAEQIQMPRTLNDQQKKQLLDAREKVWRAWFAGDHATLEKLIPDETIAIESGGDEWSKRDRILSGSVEFAKNGGKLVSLDFPKTEIQVYGATAFIYSTYAYELEVGGKRSRQTGRVTEVFVQRKGQWVNPGWHMDSVGKPGTAAAAAN
jgi:ketosteroid isomerase-like protein